MSSKSSGAVTWKVIASHDPPVIIPESDSMVKYGLKDFKLGQYKKSKILTSIFLKLSFKDWKSKVAKMNEAVEASKAKTRQFSPAEFLVDLGILVGAAEFAQRGCDLFAMKDRASEGEQFEVWASLYPEPHFEKYMSFYRWKEFRRFFQLFLPMKPGRLLIHGISFQLQSMNLMKFVEQYCLDHCGSHWMRPCLLGDHVKQL